ncbi:MAG: sulfur oxidation c-type cytochrome SoxX [Burkholderiales bacterium]|nr:sulfur oxidation c-type cytochrome SoxX [Burkholderiales bacterium]
MRERTWAALLGIAWLAALPAASAQPAAQADRAERTDRIDSPLTTTPGNAESGLRIFASRDGGHCVLCHAAPGVAVAGNIGPALHGVGRRFSAAQIRLRVVDITRVNPDAVMPAFHRTTDLARVTPERRGQPILSAQQVEDVVAWLASLQ